MTGDRAWKRLIKKLLNSKALNPTWIAERGLRRVLAPKILQYVAHSKYQEQQIWLDVGCGNRPYEALFGHHLYFGVDVPLRSEEHTSELQSLMRISYAVFCLKKQNTKQKH